MDDIEHKKINEIANKVSSISFALKSICTCYEEDITEFAKTYTLTEILDNTCCELYDIL